ncbi:OmpP1/FadL family transporter [Prevotella sp. HUN102]|uniref:OmpP1/FadL family transporter n=1 Tax=Prevotella sp. HUN102 TaxID=1392486 RepID=UPI00048EC9D9|nr:hemin receptor [Prevotella sp. HUN102]
MKKQYYFLFASLLAMPAMAQETYENARLTGEDLNGTARYVGMGGALEALGADISTIGSNPAGIGLFRHNTLSVSGGLLMQGKGNEFANGKKTNASFDQIGGVYSTRTGRKSYLNLGFNYHKSKNFNYILNAANSLNGSSQNGQSYLKGMLGSEANGGFSVRQMKDGTYMGYVDDKSDNTSYSWSQTDYLYWNTVIPDVKAGPNDSKFFEYPAQSYMFDRSSKGYIANYDFNISGNIKDRVFLGVTFGIKDVDYKGYSEYNETLMGNKGTIAMADERRVSGTGFDVTAGVIVRPLDNSPFRFGAYVKSPTWYNLTTENYTQILNNTTEGGTHDSGKISNAYDFKIWTPWKFGFSLGHTVGNYLALGLSYEYEDHSTINTRINDGVYYDYDSWYGYGDVYESTSADGYMNEHAEIALKGVSTLKLGAEYKPTANLALRIGYNYISPKYNAEAQKNPTLPSYGTSYSSATDYTNWDATNRFTCGIGYQIKKFNIDLAYQYSSQKGEFYPFSNLSVEDGGQIHSNTTTATKVDKNHSQLLLTLGYHF